MMNSIKIVLVCTAALGAGSIVACGDEEDSPDPITTTTSTTTSSGAGGAGGAGAVEELSGSITADMTLTADKDWLLTGIVFVESGATLTIEPGTTIMGEKVSTGTLVIRPGAKIDAQGTADAPIVFTSQVPAGMRAAGDWGGLVLLGNAPLNVPGGTALIEGLTDVSYGGDDPNDDSGVLDHVRIEFSGIQISPDNEINGLTLGGVGAGTKIDHVMVHHTLDDCFEFFGGTVNAKHLVCAYNGDDGFDWDYGFSGKLQFLAVVQDPTIADDTCGFEADNDADGSLNTPISDPTIYNVTLCGQNTMVDKQQYGMLLRRSTRGSIYNLIATGFEAAVDIRDATTDVTLMNSIFFGNTSANIGYVETGMDNTQIDYDDDGGFDEVAWFLDPANMNSEAEPGLTGCFTPGSPNFRPTTTLSTGAATPPDDGFFDATATYIGAFKADDTWTDGAWISYSAN
jgi:hypothetical protein